MEVERSLSFIFEAAAVLIVYVSSLTIEGFLFTLVFVLFLGFLGIRYAHVRQVRSALAARLPGRSRS